MMKTRRPCLGFAGPFGIASLTLLNPVCLAGNAANTFGEVTVRTKGTMTYGTIIRADDRNPELVPYGNGVAAGVNGTARGGTNNDDGELKNVGDIRTATRLGGQFKQTLSIGLTYRFL